MYGRPESQAIIYIPSFHLDLIHKLSENRLNFIIYNKHHEFLAVCSSFETYKSLKRRQIV